MISTKYSLTTSPGDPNASGNHRKNMVRSVEDSLKRMKTEYIDLYYLHMWDFRTPVDEILRAFDDLVRAGKILYIGLSDIPAWQASRMQAIAELRGWSQFCALQISYSLTERTVEREMIPMAAEMGMGVCPWSPLGGGVLAGKYSKADLVPPDMKNLGSRKAINAVTGRLSERNLAIAEAVGEIAQEARQNLGSSRDRLDAGQSGGDRTGARGAHRGAAQGQSRRARCRAQRRSHGPAQCRERRAAGVPDGHPQVARRGHDVRQRQSSATRLSGWARP